MLKSRLSFMMFLLYFRSSKCDRTFHWTLLGSDGNRTMQPKIPDETAAVSITLSLTGFYLFVNILLLLAAILLLCELRDEMKLVSEKSQLVLDSAARSVFCVPRVLISFQCN
jgi:hypothetical protein